MRVCYYTNLSQYRPNGAKFTAENINPFLCSHIIYAFAKLDGNNLGAYEWNDLSTEFTEGM
jgi:chitinase